MCVDRIRPHSMSVGLPNKLKTQWWTTRPTVEWRFWPKMIVDATENPFRVAARACVYVGCAKVLLADFVCKRLPNCCWFRCCCFCRLLFAIHFLWIRILFVAYLSLRRLGARFGWPEQFVWPTDVLTAVGGVRSIPSTHRHDVRMHAHIHIHEQNNERRNKNPFDFI